MYKDLMVKMPWDVSTHRKNAAKRGKVFANYLQMHDEKRTCNTQT